jgi:hypothetical protein
MHIQWGKFKEKIFFTLYNKNIFSGKNKIIISKNPQKRGGGRGFRVWVAIIK